MLLVGNTLGTLQKLLSGQGGAAGLRPRYNSAHFTCIMGHRVYIIWTYKQIWSATAVNFSRQTDNIPIFTANDKNK